MNPPPQAATAAPDEPLTQSAALARNWAAAHCAHDGQGQGCDAYHGFWQTMRLMRLGATLGGHPGHYLEAIAAWAASPHRHGGVRRVLISGCADYSMLAHVWHASATVGADLRVTVLDACPTPLQLNTWYAERLGRRVQTVNSDVLAYRPDTGLDLIVTSSFLGYFGPATRPALFQAYRRMLRGGGQLVFSNRLRAAPEHLQVGFTPEQTDQFAELAAGLSGELPSDAALDAVQAREMARAFARQTRSYPVACAQTITDLAADAGLQVRQCQLVQNTPMRSGIGGPTLGDGSRYVFVVLQR
jgi:SAM-dependent methyltransferase